MFAHLSVSRTIVFPRGATFSEMRELLTVEGAIPMEPSPDIKSEFDTCMIHLRLWAETPADDDGGFVVALNPEKCFILLRLLSDDCLAASLFERNTRGVCDQLPLPIQ